VSAVSNPFVPEADQLDQQREVGPPPVADDEPRRALDYPKRMPLEASEADVLEQEQELPDDEDDH
jgi:hypothetical protein